jgi:cyclic-di-AMP phosphodiesterase PgpH
MFGVGRKPSRLENWDGRKHSSRSEPTVLPITWNRNLILRILIISFTVFGVVSLLYLRGPAFPYRMGAVLSHDVRTRVDFQVVNELLANSPKNEESTIETNPMEFHPAGSLLAKQGQRITPAKWTLIQAEHLAFSEKLSPGENAARFLSLTLIVFLLASLMIVYVARFQPNLGENVWNVMGICSLVFITVLITFVLTHSPLDAGIIPLTVTAMIVAIAFNPPFALMLSFCLTIIISLPVGHRFATVMIHSGGLATAILLLRGIRSRTRPVEVSIYAGFAYFLMTVATGILAEQGTRIILLDSLKNMLWSLLAGFILTGSLPFLERCFGIITDARLLELADSSHPLMQELVRRAPGTYTHSMTVATLAESAAESIEANPLLVRVGSYYHDIGKMLKPDYFIENQNGENRHDQLEPALSTLVIMGHIKDGVALAKQYRLPQAIIDFIQQHHGTTLVEYFYREAMRIQEACGNGSNELEFAFRYPGPKPTSKESGILMLADSVESASRALISPTGNSLRKLVHEIMMKRLIDGQFDDSGLSLKELRQIEESLTKSLTAVYHARIRYIKEDLKQVS